MKNVRLLLVGFFLLYTVPIQLYSAQGGTDYQQQNTVTIPGPSQGVIPAGVRGLIGDDFSNKALSWPSIIKKEEIQNFTEANIKMVEKQFNIGFVSLNNIKTGRDSAYQNQDAASVIGLGSQPGSPVFASVCDGHGSTKIGAAIAQAVSRKLALELLKKKQDNFNVDWDNPRIYKEAANAVHV